jgi:hypothetical protein
LLDENLAIKATMVPAELLPKASTIKEPRSIAYFVIELGGRSGYETNLNAETIGFLSVDFEEYFSLSSNDKSNGLGPATYHFERSYGQNSEKISISFELDESKEDLSKVFLQLAKNPLISKDLEFEFDISCSQSIVQNGK